jgi:soluble lytic murein transglycosylase-like protein
LAATAITVLVLSAAALPGMASAQDAAATIRNPYAPVAAEPSLDGKTADKTAALPTPSTSVDVNGSQLPRPLDEVNADRYREIFRAQARGDFRAADDLISQLTDQSLLGDVLADRYLSATYRSKAKELTDWLKQYGSLAEAADVYALAQKKGADNAPKPRSANVVRMGSPDESVVDNDPEWAAGLASWRGRDYGAAATHFAASYDNVSDPWNKSAAAYWASRAELRAKHPTKVSAWLVKAAKQPRTFYGQLAMHALGADNDFDWRTPTFNGRHAEAVLATRTGKRALALLQVGQVNAAERELLVLQQNADDNLAEALLSLSQAARMPSLALRIGANTRILENKIITAALYPLPSWRPSAGFDVDRALLYAIMRQESGFNPGAVNPASGATGLMQLMPATARIVAGDQAAYVKDPVVSMEIGQRYLNKLTEDGNVGNDLLKVIASYNAGPGNLAKWIDASEAKRDPLLFLETLPSDETRLFTQRVVAAYWIYRQRLGQEAPSLEAVASGDWPKYQRQDLAKATK